MKNAEGCPTVFQNLALICSTTGNILQIHHCWMHLPVRVGEEFFPVLHCHFAVLLGGAIHHFDHPLTPNIAPDLYIFNNKIIEHFWPKYSTGTGIVFAGGYEFNLIQFI
jgi:hypothetical protein